MRPRVRRARPRSAGPPRAATACPTLSVGSRAATRGTGGGSAGSTNPYQSSKYAEELLAYAFQLTLGKQKRIASISTAPGTVLTGLSMPIIPEWAWVLVVPLLALVRRVLWVWTLALGPRF